MSIALRNDISLHVENGAAPNIRIGKVTAHSAPYITVGYKTDTNGYESEVKIFLDHAAAKALAEGILTKLDDMKYGTILEQHAPEQHKKAGRG